VGKWTNWLFWLPIGALIGYLWMGTIQQNQHNTRVLEQLESFKSKGPRFTADHGQDLCGSVQELQRQAGLKVRECTFGASE
jgi:hypothetical protein